MLQDVRQHFIYLTLPDYYNIPIALAAAPGPETAVWLYELSQEVGWMSKLSQKVLMSQAKHVLMCSVTA